MTNADAILILKGALKKPNRKDSYLGQAITMAIQALDTLSRIKAIINRKDIEQDVLKYQMICEVLSSSEKANKSENPTGCDLISREAVLKCFEGKCVLGKDTVSHVRKYTQMVVDKISALPSVTRRTGEWNIFESYQGGLEEKWYECSECKWNNALLIPRNYCPSCGARMKGKEGTNEQENA